MVMWVFGYGSLIWRPDFKFDERVVGYVRDYKRGFHQACIDFRGTVENPGRTLTLEPQDGAVTWGVAYRVAAEEEQDMCLAYLDQRERTYDEKAVLDFYTESSGDKPAIAGGVMAYIATPTGSNPWYLGPAPLRKMATQIARSHGSAGPNYEYLFRLEESLLNMGARCVGKEIAQLANEVRRILLRPVEAPRCFEVGLKIPSVLNNYRDQLKLPVHILSDAINCGLFLLMRPQGRVDPHMHSWTRGIWSDQCYKSILRIIGGFRSRHASSKRHKSKTQRMRKILSAPLAVH